MLEKQGENEQIAEDYVCSGEEYTQRFTSPLGKKPEGCG